MTVIMLGTTDLMINKIHALLSLYITYIELGSVVKQINSLGRIERGGTVFDCFTVLVLAVVSGKVNFCKYFL
jgi:hypothetical protein